MNIQEMFGNIVKDLKAIRTGQGNNDLHETNHYSMFVGKFPDTHIAICNKSCTTLLTVIYNETDMNDFLKHAKR